MRDGFGHRIPLDSIGDGERVDLIADEAERKAIAERLSLESLDRLEANVTLGRDAGRIHACGRIRASLEQSCVATGDPVAEHVDDCFDVVFMPEPQSAAAAEEIELAEEDCDVVFHDGSAIDLGSAIADTLALALDPYPRSASAEAALREAGVLTEQRASPFGALARLMKGVDET
ncbi:MAG TPA: YceD family protein [Sphingomicrobium sp.]|nr:YceD family protein [Sphingomicrobium sp.]